MKFVVLTTETLHHAFYVRELARSCDIQEVLLETRGVKPRFDTAHPFEEQRELYERETVFDGKAASVADYAPTTEVTSMNSAEAVERLRSLKADWTLVFGTGKLSREVIAACEGRILNLHGGDPEEYRGLDSHLWAVYHNDFEGLITTLHFLNEELDDGRIVLKAQVPLHKHMQLHELRLANTRVCLELSLAATEMLKRTGACISHPQRKIGRYYSFMPAPLKEICAERFAKKTAAL